MVDVSPILQYHWSENDGLILVDEYEHLQPAAFLKYAQDYVYVATTDQVSFTPVALRENFVEKINQLLAYGSVVAINVGYLLYMN